MRRVLPWMMLLGFAARISAQEWHAGSSIPLIRRAVAHRAERDADTLIAGWRADAHGFLRYTSVFDHGDGPRERVVRVDELLVEVYGEAPSRSKQIIRAWRDTSFLPNRMTYHRDHLGIVANDFGSTIRLGQGDEVRDIPHPLSPDGLARYEFAVGDTTTVSGPAGRVRVVSVEVRPVQRDSAGTIGTLYLDLDRAALVRFSFTFTPASYRDHTVADITVTLENSLQRNARWLPWRQSIVIRRGVPFLDFPIITVIRGDWTLDDYDLGVHHPKGWFDGPWIAGPTAPSSHGLWAQPIAAQLDGLPATSADVEDVTRHAAAAMGGQVLDGLPHLRLLAAGISNLVHINRVEGITPALGASVAVAAAVRFRAQAGIGLSDHRIVGGAAVVRERGGVAVSLLAERRVRDIADTPISSGVASSITTLFGEDQGDYVLLERQIGRIAWGTHQTRFSVEAGREWSGSVETRFQPLLGRLSFNPALGAGAAAVARVSASHVDTTGTTWSVAMEAGSGANSWGRGALHVERRFAMPSGELQAALDGGIATEGLPAYRDFVLGGQGTLPGVPFREIGGRRMARAEIWWHLPVRLPTPPIPYSRYVHLGSTLGPFVAAGVAGGDDLAAPWRGTGEVLPVFGLRLDLWGPLVRVEAGAALHTGRFGFAIDIHPDWWGVM